MASEFKVLTSLTRSIFRIFQTYYNWSHLCRKALQIDYLYILIDQQCFEGNFVPIVCEISLYFNNIY